MNQAEETSNCVYEFANFRLLSDERLLLRDETAVQLPPKVFDTLLLLVENSGHLIEKDVLLDKIWGDAFVEEGTLTRNISLIRKALGENGQGTRFIETLPKRGYRFIEPVRRLTHEEQGDSVPAADQAAKRQRSPRIVLWATLAFIAVAGLVSSLSFFNLTGANTQSVRSIAVLPLENLSGDPEQEYFADGMTEALINNLARIRALKVISRKSVMQYKGSNRPILEIARELGVDAVITGSVQRANGRVRVTAQLIQAATDDHLWARDYERDLTDVLKLEGEIARTVADEIRIQVTAEERERLASARSVNPQAHEAYLLGRYHFSKNNVQDYEQAFEHFKRATEISPDYAPAHAGLSDAWLQLGIFSVKPFNEVGVPARAAALKAVELDEQLAEAHISLANIEYLYDWDWAAAEREFRRALELDPGSLQARRHFGRLLMCLGRHDEAVSEGQTALQLDPLSPETLTDMGRFLFRARRYAEALPYLQRAVEMEPRSTDANFRLGTVFEELGKYAEAISVYDRGRQMTGADHIFQSGIAHVYAMTGRKNEARQMVDGSKTDAYGKASVYTALGDKDEAFKILEQAIDERNSLLVGIKEDPVFENLHSDPRWKTLLGRMNFPTE